jgi:hypothetical protein
MGLDMYAYTAARAGQQDEFYETGDYADGEFVNATVTKPRELAYWRKHPNLHGWMESVWKRRLHEANKHEPEDTGWGSTFNGIELELTAEDLDELERAVTHGQLPSTGGFFFGNNADEHYRDADLEFVKNARAELFLGLKVFYNSSW